MNPSHIIAKVHDEAEFKATFTELYRMGYQRSKLSNVAEGWVNAQNKCVGGYPYLIGVMKLDGRNHIACGPFRKLDTYQNLYDMTLANSTIHLLSYLRRTGLVFA